MRVSQRDCHSGMNTLSQEICNKNFSPMWLFPLSPTPGIIFVWGWTQCQACWGLWSMVEKLSMKRQNFLRIQHHGFQNHLKEEYFYLKAIILVFGFNSEARSPIWTSSSPWCQWRTWLAGLLGERIAPVQGTISGINNLICRWGYAVILVGRSLNGMLLDIWKMVPLTLTKKSVTGFWKF